MDMKLAELRAHLVKHETHGDAMVVRQLSVVRNQRVFFIVHFPASPPIHCEKCTTIAIHKMCFMCDSENEIVRLFLANSGMYAHYVFNTLDQSRSGIVSFEVRRIGCDNGWTYEPCTRVECTRFN